MGSVHNTPFIFKRALTALYSNSTKLVGGVQLEALVWGGVFLLEFNPAENKGFQEQKIKRINIQRFISAGLHITDVNLVQEVGKKIRNLVLLLYPHQLERILKISNNNFILIAFMFKSHSVDFPFVWVKVEMLSFS
jgi:hypothetical protein